LKENVPAPANQSAPPPEDRTEPLPALAVRKSLKERLRTRRVLVAGVVLILLVGGASAYFLSPGSKPAPRKTAAKKPVKPPPKVVKKDGQARPPVRRLGPERPPLSAGQQVIRLVGCEWELKTTGNSRLLTADYLPHTPGTSRTYDLAVFVPGSPGKVARQVRLQMKGGLTQTKTTHVGTLKGGSLFDPAGPKTVAKLVLLPRPIPGPALSRRVSSEFVEIGEEVAMSQGSETVWLPRLKLGARAGDSWSRSYKQVEHRFTLVRFDQRDGRPAAVITEMISGNATPPLEVVRVYVQGVGEVERREWRRTSERDKRLLSESKLIAQTTAQNEKTAGR
jgi:hypothetical protein